MGGLTEERFRTCGKETIRVDIGTHIDHNEKEDYLKHLTNI